MNFLQSILADKKLVLDKDKLTDRQIKPHWSEFAVKNVWSMVMDSEELCKYLPTDEIDQGRFPDKAFFWGVAFTIIPDWAQEYTSKVF